MSKGQRFYAKQIGKKHKNAGFRNIREFVLFIRNGLNLTVDQFTPQQVTVAWHAMGAL